MKETTTLTVTLTTPQVDSGLESIEKGLGQYLGIQKMLSELTGKSLKDNADFRKRFNGFYRIRQKPAAWYNSFYELLDESRSQSIDFPIILRSLHNSTNRYEASFSSKLVATLNPQMPIIDSIVLKNLNIKLPYQSDPNRFYGICSIHEGISRCYAKYLLTDQGRYLVSQFRKIYPNADITEVKMLDLVLWQSR